MYQTNFNIIQQVQFLPPLRRAAFDGGRANMPAIVEQDEQQTARPTSAAAQSVDVETQTPNGEDERDRGDAEGDGGSSGPLAPDSNRSEESEPVPDVTAKDGMSTNTVINKNKQIRTCYH